MVFWHPADEDMESASQRARDSFKYFWREYTWESRRILPALSIANVKLPFTDPHDDIPLEDRMTEHMWISIHDFDGDGIYGELLNQPHELKTHNQGDMVAMPIEFMSDWMYALATTNNVYGAFSINQMRAEMSVPDRKGHDQAWGGLKFGKPDFIELVPAEYLTTKKKGFLGFGKTENLDMETTEHPMALHMADAIRNGALDDSGDINEAFDFGKTVLHQMALAGATEASMALLERGADKSIKTEAGYTASDLAKKMGWKDLAVKLVE